MEVFQVVNKNKTLLIGIVVVIIISIILLVVNENKSESVKDVGVADISADESKRLQDLADRIELVENDIQSSTSVEETVLTDTLKEELQDLIDASNNSTSTVGPQGLQGPQGVKGATGLQGNTGPQGPTGDKGIVDTDITTFTTAIGASSGTQMAISCAMIGSDWKLLSGGCKLDASLGLAAYITENRPGSDTIWLCGVNNETVLTPDLTGYAMCYR